MTNRQKHNALDIVSTPIGNLEDITIRAIRAILSADYILAEDSRRIGVLLSSIRGRYALLINNIVVNSKQKVLIFNDINELERVPTVINLIKTGAKVCLTCDAGTPLISDTGYKLVSECLRQKISVTSLPGPTALITALVSSGLPTNKFLYLGFLPEKPAQRIAELKKIPKNLTVIIYVAPHKFKRTLTDMLGIFGDIEIVIARELTKIHEEIVKLKLSEAITKFSNPKGEFTILFRIFQLSRK